MSRIQFIEAVPIRPVALERVQRLRNGRKMVITADVGDIARQLQEIDERFTLCYEPGEALYTLELHEPQADGSVTEHLVGAYDELDARILERARLVSSPSYSTADELERIEREADAAQEYRRQQQVGEVAERLDHAFRKDLSRHEIGTTLKSRASIPRAFKP